MRRAGMLMAILLTVGCAVGDEAAPEDGVPLVFDLPDGTPVLDLEPVPRSDRTARVEPVLELEVGGDSAAPAFLRASDLAVGPGGEIYLLDVGAQEVKVFGADGALQSRIGGPGEGPGELSPATPAITVAGDRLLVADSLAARFTRWSLDGELIDTFTPGDRQSVAGQAEQLAGFADGSFLVVRETRAAGGGQELRFDRFARDGSLSVAYPSMPVEYTRALIGGRPGRLPVVRGRGQVAAHRQGPVYLTPRSDYQVMAVSVEGEPLWAVRVDWPRERFPDDEVDRAFDAILEPMRAMGVEAEADHDSVENLPERLPALASIKVDGHGRLWVFAYEHWDRGRPETLGEDRPVDVYDTEGKLLFSGLIPARFALSPSLGTPWMTASGDHVYGVETDPDTHEQRLVRYRLQLPSEG